MMMDLDVMEKKIHSTSKDVKGAEVEKTITAGMIQSAVKNEMKRKNEKPGLPKTLKSSHCLISMLLSGRARQEEK